MKSIYMDNSFYALNYVPATNAQAYGDSEYDSPPVKAIFTGKDNIAGIYSLHQKIVANRLAEKESFLSKRTKDNSERICLAYELKNGSHIYRQYIIAAPDYTDSLKPIYESQEYKELHNRILSINPVDVDMIEINAREAYRNVRIVDPELIEQSVDVLQCDVYDETYEERATMKQGPPWADITVCLKNHRKFSLSWKKSYINFEQWLKENGKYNQARLLPGEDITSAIVDRMPNLNKQDPDKRPVIITQEAILELEEKPGILKITDPEKLELCLRYYNVNSEQAAYKVVFLLNNGGTFSGFFFETDAPAFIKEYFTR